MVDLKHKIKPISDIDKQQMIKSNDLKFALAQLEQANLSLQKSFILYKKHSKKQDQLYRKLEKLVNNTIAKINEVIYD